MSLVEAPPHAETEVVIRPHSAVSLADLGELWRYRELLWTLAARDVSVRYKQAALGIAWALLQPLSQMVIFTVLFNRFAGIRSGSSVPYPLFCFSGLVAWAWFSSSLAQASDSLVANGNLVSKVYFPRAIMPAAVVLAAAADFAVGFGLVLVLTLWFHVSLSWTLIFAPLVAALGALIAFACGLWLAAINIQFRDVRYALPFLTQLLIYLTPVIYPAQLIPPKYQLLLWLNPMAAVVDGFRAALFGLPLPGLRLLVALAAALVVGAGGFLYFRKMEQTFADRL